MRYIIFSLILLSSCAAQSHPGRTNADGCHTDRKTGEYHCHQPKKQTVSLPERQTTRTDPLSRQTGIVRSGNILRLDYEGFTVWLDCSKRGAVKFRYNAQHDTGNEKRHGNFFLDPQVPPECQQTSAKAYGRHYDRGHLLCNL